MRITAHLRVTYQVHGPWATGSMAALGLALPLAPGLVPLFIVTTVITLLLRHRPLRWHGGSSPWQGPLPWMLAFYLWHMVGMAWTRNMGEGLFDLEVKLSLLLFPLLLGVLAPAARQGGRVLLAAFVLGNAAVVPIGLLAATWRMYSLPWAAWSQELISSPFSLFLHPSYAALYLAMALALLLLGDVLPTVGRAVRALLITSLAVGIVLMAGKMGWIAGALLLLFVLVRRWTVRARRLEAALALVLVVGGIVLLNRVSIYAAERITEMRTAIVEEEHSSTAASSTGIRWLVWDAALEALRQRPLLGAGTGDVKDELLLIYADKGYTSALEQRLNPHNQFLQSGVALGLPGLLLLLALCLVPGWWAWRRGDHLLLAFLGLNALNWTVESMLEVQAGTVFLAVVGWALMMRGMEGEEQGT
jgi:O-antigen ligase